MLTVNICHNGNQRTIEAREVTGRSCNNRFDYDEALVTGSDGEIFAVNEGRIFVMNEAGATVAKYDFAQPEELRNVCVGDGVTAAQTTSPGMSAQGLRAYRGEEEAP